MKKSPKSRGQYIWDWVLTVISLLLLVRLVIFISKQIFNFDPGNVLDKFSAMGFKGWGIQLLIIAVVSGLIVAGRYDRPDSRK